MKKDIHPTYFPEAKITCACGHVFVMGATRPEMEVEICSQCHPFYTGKEKIIDTARRIDKYQTKLQKSSVLQASGAGKKTARSRKVQKSSKQVLRASGTSPSSKKRTSKGTEKK